MLGVSSIAAQSAWWKWESSAWWGGEMNSSNWNSNQNPMDNW